jgi:hypothetical protein
MPSGLRHRFWLESVVGSITGVLSVVTLVWHDWIEAVFGVDPDKGNGSTEWVVILILMAVTILFAVGARLEWHRARLAEG